jgi:tyrosine-protein kinase Etk/Wzc
MAATPLKDSNDEVGLQREESGISIIDMIENLLYYWRWFVAVAAIVGAIGVVRAIIAIPIYTSDVLIQVEPPKSASLGALRDVSSMLDAGNSPVPGEIEVLRSRLVMERAIQASGNDVDVAIMDRVPVVGDWLARRSAPAADGLVPGPLPLHYAWGGEELVFGKFEASDRLLNTLFVLVSRGGDRWVLQNQKGDVVVEGVVGALVASKDGAMRLRVDKLRARSGNRFAIVRYDLISRVRALAPGLIIAEAGRGSNIIRASYEDTDPGRASRLLNAIADAYVEHNIGRRSEEAQRSLSFLREHLPQLKKQLEKSESMLNDYRNSQAILDITEETKSVLARSVAVEEQREALKLKRRELVLQYEPAHPALQAVDAQLAALNDEARAAERDIKRLPEREQRYLQLLRDVEVNNQLYVSLLNNAEQLEIARAGTIGNVAIIDRAVQAPIPTRPKKAQMAVFGGLVGLMLGFLVTQLIALVTGVVRDPKKLERATGMSALAILPQSPEQSESDGAESGTSFLVTARSPLSPMSEALRSLRTAVLFALSTSARGKVVLVASATASQGKSLVAANLSYLLASGGRRVLVIDADIRRRSLRNYLPIPRDAKGLSDVLAGSTSAGACVLSNVYPGLSVLPAGIGVRDPGGLFASPALREVVEWAAASYDYVVIDSAPLLIVSDSTELAKLADQTLFIVRQSETSVSEVVEAVALLRRVGGYTSRFVFNGYLPSRLRYGYGYGYGYRYGRRYGYGESYGDDAG